jgi:WD40 repeat protein
VVALWEVKSGECVATFQEEGNALVPSVAFSPDGKLLAAGDGNGVPDMRAVVTLWDIGARKKLATLDGHATFVNSVAFSPDAKILAAGTNGGAVRLWDAATGRSRAVFNGSATSVAFSPDGNLLAAGSFRGTLQLWDVVSGRVVAAVEEPHETFNSIAFSPDGKRLVAGGWSDTVTVWEVKTANQRDK